MFLAALLFLCPRRPDSDRGPPIADLWHKVLYACFTVCMHEAWSLTKKRKRKNLLYFERKILQKAFGLKRYIENNELTKLFNEPDIIVSCPKEQKNQLGPNARGEVRRTA